MFKQRGALPWPINFLANYAARDNANWLNGKAIRPTKGSFILRKM
jgi:hypothetical protein